MEVNPPGLHPPLPIRSNLSLRETPKRHATTRDQRLQKVPAEDARTRRSPPNDRAVDKTRPGVRTSPIANSRLLFPANERTSGEQGRSKINKNLDNEKWSPSVEGSAGGREGRHFTVANVGNNGQIFLRPTIRPDNQRYPQPPVVFPLTPPNTAGLDTFTPRKTQYVGIAELNGSQWTPTPMTDPPSPNGIPKSAYFDFRPATTRHRRAVSDSTAQDVTTGSEAPGVGAFRVVISKPQNEAKSKTAEDLDSGNGPFLQVSIPSWKLGTPRFTLRGTPLIRGSSYAPTEEIRSSHASFPKPPPRDKTNNLSKPETFSLRMASLLSSQSQYASPAWLIPAEDSPSSPVAKTTRTAFMPANLVIEPSMFDALTFKPTCDDRSIVRYSLTTKAVTAATPPRLVAEITSPSFLDYDLISDFFLTFRSFIDPTDLLRLLIARLRWALSQNDESGMIVKVRTFVAIRHWILNYFIDDFVVDYHLRVTFCDLVNDFTDDLPTLQLKRKVPFKIVGELKKCWRRVCAQYWDGPEFDADLGHDVAITPGGIAGHRHPSLTPSFWETDSSQAQIDGMSIQSTGPHQETRSPADASKAARVDSSSRTGVRPTTPDWGTLHLTRHQVSPTSIASLDVVSCSFPTKALRMGDPNASMSLGAHPADPSSIYTSTDPIASTPHALTGKRMRPQTSHRRNNSLTDSLREHGTMTEKVLYKNAELLLTLPYAGSLVRGNLLPPSQPFVDLDNTASKGASRHTTIFQSQPTIVTKGKASASAMSGQGMRKLLGSVRRALSTRGLGISHNQGSFIDIAPIGPRGATTNRLPGTAIVPQAQRSFPNGIQQPCRIDTLGAQIAADFNQAVREDAAETKSASTATKSLADNVAEHVEYSVAHLDSSFELRPRSDAAITTGSQSIVIVDGTAPPEHLVMTGALPLFNPSVETFADSMIRMHGRNPTPPMTPPNDSIRGNTPRRSSYILGQHVYETSLSANPLPALDMTLTRVDSIGDDAVSALDTDKKTKLPVSFVGQSSNKPPSAYFNRHKRQQSSRSYRSRGSLSLRRRASFHSGLAAQSTVRSFDATTYSEGSIKSEIMPPPLRMLRRRPGGDLRGAANTTQFDPLPLRRSHSIGSLTMYSESLGSSYIRSPIRDSSGLVDVVSGDYSQNRGDVFSLGAVAEQAPQRPLSLFSTHSSKPIMRPSFEAEAQKLAQIPDDMNDDGGVESALLKLEGKYERKTVKLSMEPLKIPSKDLQALSSDSLPSAGVGQAKEGKKKHRHLHVGEDEVPDISPIGEDSAADNFAQNYIPRHSEISSFLSEDSLETYNSIPLLDRGLTDEGRSRTHTLEWTNHSILEGPDTPVDESDAPGSTSPLNPSFEFINRTESLERVVEHAPTVNPSEDRSFLDMESDNDSELSSELSVEMIDESNYMPRPLSSNQVEGQHLPSHIHETLEIDSCPDEEESVIKLTLVQALQMSPETTHTPLIHEHQIWSQKPLPPTPDTTPTTAMYHQALGSPSGSLGSRRAPYNSNRSLEPDEQPPVHLPFILAFDSEILAQQFTLIEKDALNEVGWKELIEMKWKDSHNDPRSWVDFLRNTDARDVEVVIARFNIMVKWAISEIVLTQELEERARCVIKLLHIAAHCRQYRNFATMSQITIALTSNEVGRLSKTWAMVPPTDMNTMKDLETLVSPTRNFYNLRAEMEGGGNTADTGCIPFIGIYTHDLLFNSQRAFEIASSPTTQPLVNFERCRIAASIVKTLLRLLEASTYYEFQPIEGITERCLWMGALSDEDIRKKSESLE
ncbi:hypothetical protein E0Z10_g7574 [Xylaria hypoxylon]|uniref:Ras-GEF domain-containing protein n=1 Tax=Xylaria hypoxylon TaxID=37992 RepID=A0A4Z0YM89_9PEZI|nr:hypothetical protein E0Z10_g7574 [Xylaria hypoxylon]